ncbi:hypothetical protein ACIOD2_02470 [Amycolatopsis sp. NPDC088138]|uniref:hypothetical protein n=1 Tax=Amycolatopsis sp. NPDC088138 TaxID=3363938 RepID=UPI0037FF91D1
MKLSQRLVSGFFALVAVAGLTFAGAPAAVAKPFCDVNLTGGAKTCFTTADGLTAYETAAALAPVATLFNNVSYLGDQGFTNYTNVYNRTTCTAADSPHEASDGDLRDAYYQNNGVLMDQSVSSIYIRPGSGCRVRVFDGIGFTGSSKLVTDDADHGCADLRYCFAEIWDERIRSFWVS